MRTTSYPLDLVTVKAKQTLSVEPWFYVAKGQVNDTDKPQSPLQIVGDTSRFRVTIIEDGRPATARWTVEDMRAIKSGIADARSFANHLKWSSKASSGGSSEAYTVRFSMGTGLKGCTPAEVYAADPSGFKEKMERQKKYIEGNLGKYGGKFDAGNTKQLSAIKDALTLLESGKLSAESAPTAAPIKILSPSMKPLVREADEEGFSPVYTTEITVYPANDYPVEIKITCFKAPVEKKEDGRLNVLATRKKDEYSSSMKMTFAKFEYVLEEMEDYVKEFKVLHAAECFKESEDIVRANRNVSKQTRPDTPPHLHVISCSEITKNANGDYDFKAVKDDGEIIDIRIEKNVAQSMTCLTAFIKKADSDDGAEFRFTGSKVRNKDGFLYLFKNFVAQ